MVRVYHDLVSKFECGYKLQQVMFYNRSIDFYCLFFYSGAFTNLTNEPFSDL